MLAFDHGGKLAWKKDLGPYKSQHGGGSSPIVYQDSVILANEQDGDSFLVAVEAATGKTRWQTPRKTVETAYSTPCVYSPEGGKPSLIFNSEAHGISAIDPGTGAGTLEIGGFIGPNGSYGTARNGLAVQVTDVVAVE